MNEVLPSFGFPVYSIHPILLILIISPVVCFVALFILRIAFLEFFSVPSLFVYPLVAVFKTGWNSSVVFTSYAYHLYCTY